MSTQRFSTHPHVGQSPQKSSHVARPPKQGYSLWNFVATFRDKLRYTLCQIYFRLQAAIFDSPLIHTLGSLGSIAKKPVKFRSYLICAIIYRCVRGFVTHFLDFYTSTHEVHDILISFIDYPVPICPALEIIQRSCLYCQSTCIVYMANKINVKICVFPVCLPIIRIVQFGRTVFPPFRLGSLIP